MKAKKFKVGETYNGIGEVKGISFNLLKRHGNLCVFERSDGYYEVGEVEWREKRTVQIGSRIAQTGNAEYYPTGESWVGKCVSSLKRAEEIFSQKIA